MAEEVNDNLRVISLDNVNWHVSHIPCFSRKQVLLT